MSVKEMYMGREMTGTTTLAESVYEEMGGDTPLITESQTVKGAVNELKTIEGTEAYDNTATYAVGDYCIYNSTRYKCITAVTTAEDFDSTKWSATTTNNDITELNTSLANTITAYGKGTYRLSAINNAYGYITGGGNNLYINIPINVKPEVDNISISELLLGLRVMPGGYAGEGDNFNALSYIITAGIRKSQNMIMIYLVKSNGWGATNNTPAIGSATISFTLS